MKPFEYAAPKTLKDATALLADSWGRTEILAGGTDLVTALKQRLTQPDRVVSLKNIPELKGIETAGRSVRIGAMATLEELAGHATVKAMFPSLVTAVRGIGSDQILSVGTVGGDLCQRPRCWYFRNGHGLLARKDGKSLAREGDNRYHALFANDGPALFVNPSSLGPALVALGASVVAVGPEDKRRTIPAAEFFRIPKTESERETVLKPNEILTEIQVPIGALKNATYEVRHRHGLDWPYVTATVALHVRGGTVANAMVMLGHVAPIPWAAGAAAAALNGKAMNDTLAATAAEAAVTGARPLSGNAYKIPMLKAAVKRAILAAAAG